MSTAKTSVCSPVGTSCGIARGMTGRLGATAGIRRQRGPQVSCYDRSEVEVPAPIGAGRQAVFAPLDDGSGRSEAVVRRLGSAIALGLIADGEQLPAEAELATSLGVATVTLREALSDLRRRGLVETRRGRAGGSFVRLSEPALSALSRSRVRELGSAALRELGEFHAAVAGTAARLAAERASGHEIGRLSATLDRFEQAPTTAGRRRVEGRYFIEVAAAAQSVRLTRQEIELQSELAELQLFPSHTAGWAKVALERYRAVVDAIGNRDGALARRLTEEWIGTRTLGMIEVHLALMAGADPAQQVDGVPDALEGGSLG